MTQSFRLSCENCGVEERLDVSAGSVVADRFGEHLLSMDHFEAHVDLSERGVNVLGAVCLGCGDEAGILP